MNILAGMSGLKAAADMTKMLRDGLKSEKIPVDQLSGRIGEIYDYIIDAKAALVDAQEENQKLKGEILELRSNKAVFPDGDVYWEKREDGSFDGPLCPSCWGLNEKRVRILRNLVRNHADYAVYQCHHHGAVVAVKVPLAVLKKYNVEL